MGIRFDSGTTDALRLSSGIFDYNAAYTIMAWVYPVSNPAADMQPFSVAVDGSNLDQLRTGSSATSWSARSIVGGTAIASSTASVDYAVWQHLVLTRTDSSNLYLYKDGTVSTASNQAAGGRSAATQLDAGNGRAGTTPLNGRMYAIKAWTVALTAAEIASEMQSVRPVRLANLWGWWPGRPGATERLIDYSGNGRSWTELGTLSDEDPPPVWWGARSGSKASVPAAPAADRLPARMGIWTPPVPPPQSELRTIGAVKLAPTDRVAPTRTIVNQQPLAGEISRVLPGAARDAPAIQPRLAPATGVLTGSQPVPGAQAVPVGAVKVAPIDRVALTRTIAGQQPLAGGVTRALPGAARTVPVAPPLFPFARYTFAVPVDVLTSSAARTRAFTVTAQPNTSVAARTRSFTIPADTHSEA